MAKIIKTSAILVAPGTGTTPTTYDFDEMQTLVENYWNGDLTTERMFPIAYWKIKQLFAASPSDEVALRVTDIANTSFVDAKWIVFDENLEDFLQDPIQANEYYFVLDEMTFNGPLILPNGTIRGISQRIQDEGIAANTIIWGRLGKETVSGVDKYYAFFNAASCQLLNFSGGGGGGATGGVKLPPQG